MIRLLDFISCALNCVATDVRISRCELHNKKHLLLHFQQRLARIMKSMIWDENSPLIGLCFRCYRKHLAPVLCIALLENIFSYRKASAVSCWQCHQSCDDVTSPMSLCQGAVCVTSSQSNYSSMLLFLLLLLLLFAFIRQITDIYAMISKYIYQLWSECLSLQQAWTTCYWHSSEICVGTMTDTSKP